MIEFYVEHTEAEAEDKTAEEQRRFNIKKTATAFSDIASEIARFEKKDLNSSHDFESKQND
jgi:hypothetical protein